MPATDLNLVLTGIVNGAVADARDVSDAFSAIQTKLNTEYKDLVNNAASLTGNNSFTGANEFAQPVKVPDPVLETDAANKRLVTESIAALRVPSLGGVYISPWQYIAGTSGSENIEFTHNLGALPFMVLIQLSNKPDGICVEDSDWTTFQTNAFYDWNRGCYVKHLTTTTATIHVNKSYKCDIYDKSGQRRESEPMYMRVTCIA